MHRASKASASRCAGSEIARRHRLPDRNAEQVTAHPQASGNALLLAFRRAAGHVETNSLHLVKNPARSGNYVALTSEFDTAEDLAGGVLRFVPIVDSDAIRQTSGAAVAASKPLSSIVEIVANCTLGVIEAALRAARSPRSGPTDSPSPACRCGSLVSGRVESARDAVRESR